nr:MAG TPA: Protein CXorf40A-overexpressed LPS associated factor 1 [Caudoviricetes sp.]
MNSYIESIRPEWVKKIVNREKTFEVRKSAPKEVPFKVYIYCTKDRKNLLPIEHGKVLEKVNFWENTDAYYGFGKVIGEFICDKVYSIKNQGNSFVVANEEQGVTNEIARQSCLDYDDMVGYLGNKDGYGWHISDLKIYDKPKELSEFSHICSYKNDDGSCQCRKVDCLYQQRDYNTDGSVNLVTCGKSITRPPQSYMRVEELGE